MAEEDEFRVQTVLNICGIYTNKYGNNKQKVYFAIEGEETVRYEIIRGIALTTSLTFICRPEGV